MDSESSTLGATTTELGEVRATDLANAASEIGIGHVEFFDYPDGALDGEPIDRVVKHVYLVAAIICHARQTTDNPVLLQRLDVQGDREVLRWLVSRNARNGLSPLSDQDDDQQG